MKHKLRVSIGYMIEELEMKNESMYFGSDISKDSINVAAFSDKYYFNISLMTMNKNAKKEIEEIIMEYPELFVRVLLLCAFYGNLSQFLWRF